MAGIDVNTGHWVRPMPPDGGGIPHQHVVFRGHVLAPLDIIELNISQPHLTTRYQRENCVMPAYDWRIIERTTPDQILRYCDATVPILHTTGDRVAPALLDGLSSTQWKSLQLVHANNVEFCRDSREMSRWRATFTDTAGNRYALKVTDSSICDRLLRGETINQECLLTVSLTEPWAGSTNSAMCYKLIAAVIEISN